MNSLKLFLMTKLQEALLVIDTMTTEFFLDNNLSRKQQHQAHLSLEQVLWDVNSSRCLLWWVSQLKEGKWLSLMMIILKSAILTDNFCSEDSMLVRTNVKLLVELERKWTVILTLKLLRQELHLRTNISSMITSGLTLTLLLTLLIMSRQDNMLMVNVYGLKNLSLNQVLLELNVTLRSLFLMQLSAILISLILLRKVSLFVPWKTSLIKLSILFNGLETILKELLLILQVIFLSSTIIEKTF